MKDRSFWGVVVLKDWVSDPSSGRNIRGFAGRVSIVSAEESLGFRTSSSESNWIATVAGQTRDGKEEASVPGCQVRAVIRTTKPVNSSDYLHIGDEWRFGSVWEPEADEADNEEEVVI